MEKVQPDSLFSRFWLENIKQKIYDIVNHKNWEADITRSETEEMDVSNSNTDKFGEHIDGKGKRFTLFVFSN